MLNNITIKGYKSIKDLSEFELKNLNILIGANGAGKSNFISVFKMLNALFNKNLQFYTQ
ncbi:AAA family ATPase, partial [Campylobacter lari]|nr:AAA family ATPase [Campylobacter lari]